MYSNNPISFFIVKILSFKTCDRPRLKDLKHAFEQAKESILKSRNASNWTVVSWPDTSYPNANSNVFPIKIDGPQKSAFLKKLEVNRADAFNYMKNKFAGKNGKNTLFVSLGTHDFTGGESVSIAEKLCDLPVSSQQTLNIICGIMCDRRLIQSKNMVLNVILCLKGVFFDLEGVYLCDNPQGDGGPCKYIRAEELSEFSWVQPFITPNMCCLFFHKSV